MDTETKNLCVFDMDYTLINENTAIQIYKQFKSPDTAKKFKARRNQTSYGEWMQEVLITLKEEGRSIEDIKAMVTAIPLTEGMKEVLEFLKSIKEEKNLDCVLVSGSNTTFVQWVVEHHGLESLFKSWYTNISEPCEENILSTKNYHIHDCLICDASICKRIVFNDLIKERKEQGVEYNKIVYSGDGLNDFCPSTELNENAILFPRKNFPLWGELFIKNEKDQLKCKIVPWETGHEILKEIKNFF